MRKSFKNVRFVLMLIGIMSLISVFGINSVSAQALPGLSVSANKKSYSPGESGVLTLSFKTGSKVKIPKEPEIVVNLTTDNVNGGGLQDYTGGDGDYVSNSKVKYNFTIPEGAQSGSTITISGNVKFGYCSSSDGVCKLGNKEFTAKVKVK